MDLGEQLRAALIAAGLAIPEVVGLRRYDSAWGEEGGVKPSSGPRTLLREVGGERWFAVYLGAPRLCLSPEGIFETPDRFASCLEGLGEAGR